MISYFKDFDQSVNVFLCGPVAYVAIECLQEGAVGQCSRKVSTEVQVKHGMEVLKLPFFQKSQNVYLEGIKWRD